MKFNIASEEDILSGENADIYFKRALSILEKNHVTKDITAELTVSSFESPWINFSGLDEVITLLEGNVDELYAIPEGSILPYRDANGTPVPFIILKGRYEKIGLFETSILGFICQSSGISSASSRIGVLAGDKPFFSFGIRRMHPAISPMIDRAAFIGGASGVSGIKGAELLGQKAIGTMPHALSLLLGDETAWKAVSESLDRDEKVTVLIDTFDDEKFAAIKAAESLDRLDFIRLDTPASRRGNFANIIREVRWELDLRGYRNVRIMVSGGLREADIPVLREAGADAFGVGTSIASGKTVDFSMDIVELGHKPITKKGKFSGFKMVSRCDRCHKILVHPGESSTADCSCGGKYLPLMQKYISNGKCVLKSDPVQARERAVKEIGFAEKYQ